MISHVYSKSVLQSSPPLERQAEIILYDRLLPFLSSPAAADKKSGIDVLEIWNSTALDFITAYQFGLKNGSNFLRDVEYRRHWLHLYYARKTYPYFTQELPRLTRFLKYFALISSLAGLTMLTQNLRLGPRTAAMPRQNISRLRQLMIKILPMSQ